MSYSELHPKGNFWKIAFYFYLSNGLLQAWKQHVCAALLQQFIKLAELRTF